MCQVYDLDGLVVWLDKSRGRRFEVFVPTERGLWCVGEFNDNYKYDTWHKAEQHAARLVNEWRTTFGTERIKHGP